MSSFANTVLTPIWELVSRSCTLFIDILLTASMIMGNLASSKVIQGHRRDYKLSEVLIGYH